MERKNKRDLAFAIICMILIALLCCSCKTRYVTVESVRTDTLYRSHTDTIRKVDSIYREKETIIREADSTQLLELGIKLKENERAILVLQRQLEKEKSSHEEHKTDTVYEHKVDSIPVIVEVEKPLSKWQSWKMRLGGWAMSLIAMAGALGVLWILRKFRILRLW